MNRRSFIKMLGTGGVGLALASVISLPEVKNKPKTEEWLKKTEPIEIVGGDLLPDADATYGYDSSMSWTTTYLSSPLSSSAEPFQITTPNGVVYFSKMAERLKEIEEKVFDV